MEREEIERLIEESAHHARKSRKGGGIDKARKVLNILFLILAAAGVVLYFALPEQHLYGMAVIAVGMLLKVVEFFLRFLF